MREKLHRSGAIRFIAMILKELFELFKIVLLFPHKIEAYGFHFAELYSKLWDYSEHSISNREFDLPSVFANGPVQNINSLLKKLYSGKYACLSFGGSSGAILTLLTAVIPKLRANQKLILFDSISHQSTIGGLIFGRWQAVRIPRNQSIKHGTVQPIKFETVKSIIEEHGPENFAAVILVLPPYDGFRSKSEEIKIHKYAKTHGILVIIDGAWDSAGFRYIEETEHPVTSHCDVWITSPHKRGFCPSSLGCIITNREDLARLWDEALDLGFRSSSVSFVEIMVAEHRLSQIVKGNLESAFQQAEKSAEILRRRINDIHADIYVVEPHHVGAESVDPAHILINTSNLQNFDARIWAQNLSLHFSLDVEKATSKTLLLLCASPAHQSQIDRILSTLKSSLHFSFQDAKAS